MNCTAIAHRIRPSTRTTMIMPILPSSRLIRPVIQNEARMLSEMAPITPTPTG